MHRDTPVEILHTVLLGSTKYLWRSLIEKSSPAERGEMMDKIKLLSKGGLNGFSIDGTALIRYSGSRTGDDFRKITQMVAFFLPSNSSDLTRKTWASLSRLSSLVHIREITNIDEYIVSASSKIVLFVLIFTSFIKGVS